MAPRKAPTKGSSNINGVDAEIEQLAPPFFNTTFSTHRASPLYIGPQGLTSARLERLARRLRDTLVGDVVRGIQISLEATDTPTGQVGALRRVAIRRFQLQSILGEPPSAVQTGDGSQDGDSGGQGGGIWIEISHENAGYVALLLPGLVDSTDRASSSRHRTAMQFSKEPEYDARQFLHLPLLLLRMPQSLRAVVCEWLSTTFDCRVSRLTLGTKTLVGAMEDWIAAAGVPSKRPDFVLTLAFNAPLGPGPEPADPDTAFEEDQAAAEPGLRTLEMTIAAADLDRFLEYGQAHGVHRRATPAWWEHDARERQRLAGGHMDDGWAWRTCEAAPSHLLTEALGRYLDHHLGLDLFHPSVRIVQISCGSFVLAQSRLKLVRLGDISDDVARAAWMFVTQLGARLCQDSYSLA